MPTPKRLRQFGTSLLLALAACDPGGGRPWTDLPVDPIEPNVPPGSSYARCKNGQVIEGSEADLGGFSIFSPAQKMNDPRAGESSYVYLASGREGVALPGPSVANGRGRFTLDRASIKLVDERNTSARGYEVIANANLRYEVAIDDFEAEVALAQVELCTKDGFIESNFIFVARPHAGGVAHAITISGFVDGSDVASGSSKPVTVEARE